MSLMDEKYGARTPTPRLALKRAARFKPTAASRKRARLAAMAAPIMALRRSLISEFSYLHVNNVNQAAVADGSQTTLMTGIAQGADEANRRGNKIQLVQLRMQLTFFPKVVAASFTKAVCFGRIVIGMVKDTSGATRALQSFMQASASAPQATNSHWDEDKVPAQFVPLVDERFHIGLTTGEPCKQFAYTVNLTKYAPTTFLDNAAVVASTQGNHLFFQIIAAENSATDGMLYNMSSKLKFIP